MMKGRVLSTIESRKRSATAREKVISNESQKNKAKKGVNDTIASDSLKKGQLLLSENTEILEKLPTITDESINTLNKEILALNEINDGNESDGTDATPKRSSSYITRISVIFFVPPSENEADKKLLLAASKWMSKMEESDKKIALLPWYDSDMGELPIRSFKIFQALCSCLRNSYKSKSK